MMQAQLFVVATPIGNMDDLSFRALEVLRSVDLVLCEDTRVTKKLLRHYDIDTKTMSYHSYSGRAKVSKILNLLSAGQTMALVSDAGTPTISDPGSLLVQQVLDAGYYVAAVPGPTAVTAALSISGIIGGEFAFLGFLPHKKGRKTLFNEIATAGRTMVFYESPHRLEKTLQSLVDYCGQDRPVVVARELTKLFEQVVRGTAASVQNYFVANPDKIRGEFVIMVESK